MKLFLLLFVFITTNQTYAENNTYFKHYSTKTVQKIMNFICPLTYKKIDIKNELKKYICLSYINYNDLELNGILNGSFSNKNTKEYLVFFTSPLQDLVILISEKNNKLLKIKDFKIPKILEAYKFDINNKHIAITRFNTQKKHENLYSANISALFFIDGELFEQKLITFGTNYLNFKTDFCTINKNDFWNIILNKFEITSKNIIFNIDFKYYNNNPYCYKKNFFTLIKKESYVINYIIDNEFLIPASDYDRNSLAKINSVTNIY